MVPKHSGSNKSILPSKGKTFDAEQFAKNKLDKDSAFKERFNAFKERNFTKANLLDFIKQKYKLSSKETTKALDEFQLHISKASSSQNTKSSSKNQGKQQPKKKVSLDDKFAWESPKIFKGVVNYVNLIKRNPTTELIENVFFSFSLAPDRRPIFHKEWKYTPPLKTFIDQQYFEQNIKGKKFPIQNITHLQDLYTDLKKYQSKFVYFIDERYHDIIALLTLASYFPEIFYTYPYLDTHAPTHGCGKTNLMTMFIYCCYHGMIQGATTSANIYRISQDGLIVHLGIDRLDLLKSDKRIVELLDLGYKKGIGVYRYNKDTGKQDYFEPFGIKAWTRTEDVDRTHKDRSIKLFLLKKPLNVNKEIDDKPEVQKFRDLRNRVYMLRFDLSKIVKKTYEALNQHPRPLEDRSFEIYSAILTIAKLIDPSLFDEMLMFAAQLEEHKQISSFDPFKILMVQVLWDNVDEWRLHFQGRILLRAYNDRLDDEDYLKKNMQNESVDMDSRKIYTVLRSLGFSTEVGAARYTYVNIDKQLLKALAMEYGFFKESKAKKQRKQLQTSKKGKKTSKAPIVIQSATTQSQTTTEELDELDDLFGDYVKDYDNSEQETIHSEASEAVEDAMGECTGEINTQVGDSKSTPLPVSVSSRVKNTPSSSLPSSSSLPKSSFKSPNLPDIEELIFRLLNKNKYKRIFTKKLMKIAYKEGFEIKNVWLVITWMISQGWIKETPNERLELIKK